MTVTPYGEWPSPITPDVVVAASASLGGAQRVGGHVFWSELRPSEGGRVQLVRRADDGSTTDLLPEGFSARTRVHEYGGGAWTVTADAVFFSNWDDQRLYRLDHVAGVTPVAITPEPAALHGFRFADADVLGGVLVAVRERHDTGGEAANELVAIPVDGATAPTVVHAGPDFVAAPRLSPDGRTLAWFQWHHPDMPWDTTQLCTAPFDADTHTIGDVTVVAGGDDESVIEPRWHPDGTLHFVSDRTDWWNVYRLVDGTVEQVTDLDAEVGIPHWVFGAGRYGWLADGRLVLVVTGDNTHCLCVQHPDGTIASAGLPYTEISSIAPSGDTIVAIGASFDTEPTIVEFAVDSLGEAGIPDVLRPPRVLPVGAEWFSAGAPVQFPSGDRVAHGLYYPPTNPDHTGPEGEAPPLLVMIHGGPTAMARAQLNLGLQYWTSRGFAVVDVNYGGSTGFGRRYRKLLDRNWGVVDVEDCISAARHLAEQGLADPDRLCIRGGSAGGFTTLAALAFADTFSAGASSYGVADLSALAEETHKFESRYLDSMVGPYPEMKSVYDERSPINHVDGFDKPLIVFQGLEDEVVPPNQSEMIVDALRTKGVPVAYLPFEGEQHGFRKADTVVAVLHAELTFYGRVLGFTPAGERPPLVIDNLD